MDAMNTETVVVQPDKAGAKKTLSKIGLAYLLGTIIIYAVTFILRAVLSNVAPDILDNPNLSLALLSVVPMYLIGFPFIIFLMKKIPAVKIQGKALKVGEFLLYALICIGLAYAANFTGLIITTILGFFIGNPVSNAIVEVATAVSPVTVLIYMVIMAPIMEEFMFRKLIIDRTIKYGKVLSIILSGLMFGLYHGNLNQFIYAFVIGAFFAFMYIKTGDIKVTIGMHMLFNFIGGFLASNLLNMLHLDDAMQTLDTSDPEAVMELVSGNLMGWALYGIFIMFVFTVLIAGIILFIVFCAKGKFKVKENAEAIPAKQRLGVIYSNIGMILYTLFWVVMIILQLVGIDKIL